MRVYVMPMVGTGGYRDAKRPKYQGSMGPSSSSQYTPDMVCTVVCDPTAGQQTTIGLDGDVISYPANLDNIVLLGALLGFANAHEAKNIPADWIVIGMTHRVVARRVFALMRMSQRMHGNGELLREIDFDADLSEYSAGALAAFYQSISDLGLSDTGISNGDSLRVALLKVIEQVDEVALDFGSLGTV